MMGGDVMEYFQERGERAYEELQRQGEPMTIEEFAKLIGTHPLDAWTHTVWMTLETHGYKIVKK